ncbi:MAG: hypothetical protein HYZ28_09920 [Myxococcales bacterium]|nr:hypothetical protein [Myxococcales bacterium]
MSGDRQGTIPRAVLERARRLALEAKSNELRGRVPPPPTPPKPLPVRLKREKIVRALKRLHPMD